MGAEIETGASVWMDTEKARAEKQTDGTYKVWLWVAVTKTEEGKKYLPTERKWERIRFEEGPPDRPVEWLKPLTAEEMDAQIDKQGFAELGEMQGWKPAHKYPVIGIYEQPRKRVIWEQNGKWVANRSMAYSVKSRPPKGDAEWTRWTTWELGPFEYISEQAAAALEKDGYYHYKTEGEIHKVLAKILLDEIAEPPQRVYMFEDPPKRTYGLGKRSDFCGWTKDPQGKNLPSGSWEFTHAFTLEKWDKFEHWNAEAVLQAIAEKGYFLDWVEIPSTGRPPVIRVAPERASSATVIEANRDPVPATNVVEAAIQKIFGGRT